MWPQVLTHRSRDAHRARQAALRQHQQPQEAQSPPSSGPQNCATPGNQSSTPQHTPALLGSQGPGITGLHVPIDSNQADLALPGPVAKSSRAAAAHSVQASEPNDRALPAQPAGLAQLEYAGDGSACAQAPTAAQPDADTRAAEHQSLTTARLHQATAASGSSGPALAAEAESSQLRESIPGASIDSRAAEHADSPGRGQSEQQHADGVGSPASCSAGDGRAADIHLASIWAALERLPLSSEPGLQVPSQPLNLQVLKEQAAAHQLAGQLPSYAAYACKRLNT